MTDCMKQRVLINFFPAVNVLFLAVGGDGAIL